MSVSSQASADGQTITIVPVGNFDYHVHKEFRDAYKDASPSAAFVIDMTKTEYMDSSALGMLLLLREHAGGEKARVTISNCGGEIRKILEISNFQKLFKIS